MEFKERDGDGTLWEKIRDDLRSDDSILQTTIIYILQMRLIYNGNLTREALTNFMTWHNLIGACNTLTWASTRMKNAKEKTRCKR